MRVGLIVDHPKRDLPGALILAYQLAQRGARSSIIPMYEQGVDIPRLGLNAVVVNYARLSNKDLIRRYAQHGIAVFVLDTEGGVLASNGGNSPRALAQRTKDDGYGEMLSGYFFWGETLRNAFAEAAVMPGAALHVSGCPRFDFAAPRWRRLLDREQRDYLLVNANFPLINPRFSTPLQECESMVQAGWDGGYVARLIKDMQSVFVSYLAEIRRLVLARPEQQILVRPHPFESDRPYIETFGGLSNVTVDGAGSVLSVIRNAAAVLHLNCGTAVEAVMLNKLPVQLDYLNTPATAGHAALPAKVSRQVASFDELLDVVDRLPEESEKFDFAGVYAAHIEEFFHLNDGDAAGRVADILVNVGARRPRLTLLDTLRGCRPNPTRVQLLKGFVSAAIGSAAASSARSLFAHMRSDKALDLDFARALLRDIAEADGSPPPRVSRARCRVTGVPLASLSVEAA